jgi:hypothetical protein
VSVAVKLNLSGLAETKLAEAVSSFYGDPLGFVMFAFPWGEPTLADGSFNALAEKKGPEDWQRRILVSMGKHIRDNAALVGWGLDKQVARYARSSGHGVGKSALVAWIILFLMSTRRDTRGVVTANTQTQLETRTWPELAKWHNLLICGHWFEWTATSYYFKMYPPEKQKNYMFSALTVSEHNTEAFQGLHNETSSVCVIFDEAGGIFSKLWEVAEGALTDGEGWFFAFGNPTQPTGAFADCFDKYTNLYATEFIDSRSVSHTNKSALNDIIRKYGEDSDEARVRVYGKFPRQAFNGFISHDVLMTAIQREYVYDRDAAIVMAVDVARYGKDSTVIRVRQGRDARTRPPVQINGKSTVEVARIIQREYNIVKPDALIVESTGPGAGVIDSLRDWGYKVIEVHPGANSSEPLHYYRKRDEMWGKMRDWLIDEGCIADEKDLVEQLSKIQYTLDRFDQRIKIEPKDDYIERTRLGSPDEADSLALTFAVQIARRDRNLDAKGVRTDRTQAITDYDPHAY